MGPSGANLGLGLALRRPAGQSQGLSGDGGAGLGEGAEEGELGSKGFIMQDL